MKTARVLAVLVLATALAVPALATTPGTELWIIAATNEGSWVTDLVIHNPQTVSASVNLYWLNRNANNGGAVPLSFTVKPGETLALPDVILNTFGLSESPGAIRITSNVEIIATSRIYDQGTGSDGTRGQGFDAIPTSAAINATGSATTEITGVQISNAYRANFFAVNTSSSLSSISLFLLDSTGAVIAQSDELLLRVWEPKYYSSATLFGANTTVSGGTVLAVANFGTVLVVGSNVDNTSGDPNTLSASASCSSSGTVDGVYVGLVDYTQSGAVVFEVINRQLVMIFGDFVFFSPNDGGTGCGHTATLYWDTSSDAPIDLNPDGSFSVQLTLDNSYDSETITYVHQIEGQLEATTISGTWQVDVTGTSCNGELNSVVFTLGRTDKTVEEVIPAKL